MALIKKFKSGDKTEEPKKVLTRQNVGNYDADELAKSLTDSLQSEADKYKGSDRQAFLRYSSQLVQAVKDGNVTINTDGSISINGNYGLNNDYTEKEIQDMKDNGKVSFWTRQGQKYEGLVDLEKDLLECTDDNFVFDGELVAIDTDLENTYKNTMKLSRTKELEKHGLKMLVFDYMPIANFKAQKCPIDYSTRRTQLSAIFDSNCFKYFELLPILYKGTDTSKIVEILNEQVSKGEEGIMLNICNAPYDFKRTNNLLKCKKFKDTEVEIIGFEEGANKLAGTLGAFVCKYKDNIVKVGSGLSDEDRSYFWANRDKYLGKLLTVKYFETSVDSKTGLESLRFPIYMRVRED